MEAFSPVFLFVSWLVGCSSSTTASLLRCNLHFLLWEHLSKHVDSTSSNGSFSCFFSSDEFHTALRSVCLPDLNAVKRGTGFHWNCFTNPLGTANICSPWMSRPAFEITCQPRHLAVAVACGHTEVASCSKSKLPRIILHLGRSRGPAQSYFWANLTDIYLDVFSWEYFDCPEFRIEHSLTDEQITF